jgi:hypothetical protein
LEGSVIGKSMCISIRKKARSSSRISTVNGSHQCQHAHEFFAEAEFLSEVLLGENGWRNSHFFGLKFFFFFFFLVQMNCRVYYCASCRKSRSLLVQIKFLVKLYVLFLKKEKMKKCSVLYVLFVTHCLAETPPSSDVGESRQFRRTARNSCYMRVHRCQRNPPV